MNKISEDDKFFMDNGEAKLVIKAKKRQNKLSSKDDTKDVSEEIRKWMNAKQFNNEYEVVAHVRKGDVYNIHFLATCGAELHGDHFVVALTDSRPNNPLVLVAPLTSFKGMGNLNPASDLYIGYVKGILNGKESVVVLNQIQAIDKVRLLNAESLSRVDSVIKENNKKNEEAKMIQLKNKYRLKPEQIKCLLKSTISFFFAGTVVNKKTD